MGSTGQVSRKDIPMNTQSATQPAVETPAASDKGEIVTNGNGQTAKADTTAGKSAGKSKAPKGEGKAAEGNDTPEARAKLEWFAFYAEFLALCDKGAKLGALALNEAARQLGASGSKAGRPSEEAFFGFVLAQVKRDPKAMNMQRRAELATIANRNVPNGHKPVATLKNEFSGGEGKSTYKYRTPALTAIAME